MSTTPPPAPWKSLLRRALHPLDRAYALADLEESHERRALREGTAAADRWYRQQVLRSLLPALGNRWARRPRLARIVLEDLRFALRSLGKTPMVTVITVASLAVGIGATTAVFSAANAFLRPPASVAIATPATLVSVFTSENSGIPYGRNSVLDIQEIEASVEAFAGVSIHRLGFVELEHGDWVASRMIEIVSGNYFDVLGTQLAAGRGFNPAETTFGSAERVAVISSRLWEETFGRAPNIVGDSLLIDGDEFTVIGVAPAPMTSRMLALRADVWVPIGIPGGVFRSTEAEWSNRTDRDYGLVARLAADATIEQAAAQLEVVAARLHDEHPREWETVAREPRVLTILPESEARVPPNFRAPLAATTGLVVLAAAMVLAVACFNVAGLMLARTGARRREIAVRLALGARRARLAGLLLTESLLVAGAACGLGILMASQLVRRFSTIQLPIGNIALQFDVSIDGRVLGFAILVAIAASVGFGMLPAWRGSRPDLVAALRGLPDKRQPGRRLGFRNLLVLAQVAGALVFVAGAATALRSFDELVAMDWGVNADGVAIMTKTSAPELSAAERFAEYRALQEKIANRPETSDVQLGSAVEGTSLLVDNQAAISALNYDPTPGESTRVPFNTVTPGYLEMLEVRMVAGRTFRESDHADAERVAVVNESFARRFWPGQPALGQRFDLGTSLDSDGNSIARTEGQYRVVGVAADARYQGLEQVGSDFFWTAMAQTPPTQLMIVARAHGGVGEAVRVLREEVPVDLRGQTLLPPGRLTDFRDFQFAFIRLVGSFLGAAGAFGLLLATLGLYGTVSFSVDRRGREMAIRQALGALPGQVIRQVFSTGMWLSAAGLLLGTAVVIPLIVLLRAEVEGLAPIEPLSLLIGAGVVIAATAIASYVPARRVTRVEPVETLRAD